MTATMQRDELDEARTAVLEAEAAVATTEEAILSGAKGVGAADLLAAERTADEARNVLATALDLRGRRDAREAEAIRVARLAEMRDLIRDRFGAHEGGIVEAFDAAVAALGTLAAKVDDHNVALGFDAHGAAHLGLPADSRTPLGLSDELRRTARIVAGR